MDNFVFRYARRSEANDAETDVRNGVEFSISWGGGFRLAQLPVQIALDVIKMYRIYRGLDCNCGDHRYGTALCEAFSQGQHLLLRHGLRDVRCRTLGGSCITFGRIIGNRKDASFPQHPGRCTETMIGRRLHYRRCRTCRGRRQFSRTIVPGTTVRECVTGRNRRPGPSRRMS